MSASRMVAASRAIVLVLIGNLACISRDSESPAVIEAVAVKAPALDRETCLRAHRLSDFSLAGWPSAQRARLERLARRGVVPVRYARAGCVTTLDLVEDCTVRVAYHLRLRSRFSDRTIEMAETVVEELPLGAQRFVTGLRPKHVLFIDWKTASELSLSPLEAVRRDDLAGAGCGRVTHLIRGIELGHMSVLAGSEKSITQVILQDGMSGVLDVETLERVGKAAACEAAGPGAMRPTGCSTPIRVSLLPVGTSSAGPSTMVRVEADGPAASGGASRAGSVAGFEIDRTEVSAVAYAACVRAGACRSAGTGRGCTAGVFGKALHPINCISWLQARDYCRWRDKRLPTGAEWARAATGRDGRAYVWGSDWPPPESVGNFSDEVAHEAFAHWHWIGGYYDGFVATAPVEAFADRPAPSGALQMAGNVCEWTADAYRTGKRQPGASPARVVRGSCFGMWRQEHLRADRRQFYLPQTRSMHVGVRCAR